MTTEQQPTIKLELTDKQLQVLGTAIGAEVVRSFSAKQEYWYGSTGWLLKLTEKLGETIVSKASAELQYNSSGYAKIISIICHNLSLVFGELRNNDSNT